MAIEIERKFLVTSTDYRQQASSHSRIRQGYICRESGRTVRVRIRDGRGFLTIKGPSSNGMSRYEFEKEITPATPSRSMSSTAVMTVSSLPRWSLGRRTSHS